MCASKNILFLGLLVCTVSGRGSAQMVEGFLHAKSFSPHQANVEVHIFSAGTYLINLGLRGITYGDFSQIIITSNAGPIPVIAVTDPIELAGYDHGVRIFNPLGTQNVGIHYIIPICHNLPPGQTMRFDMIDHLSAMLIDTIEFSPEKFPPADLNHDNRVNLEDFFGLTTAWQSHSPWADIVPSVGDGTVDARDFLMMSNEWLGIKAALSLADLNNDDSVNLADFAMLAQSWMMTGWNLADIAPFEDDQIVNLMDLRALSSVWLASAGPFAVSDFNCDQDLDMQDFLIFGGAWLNDVPRVDIAPHPIGDGSVNFLDFALVAKDSQ